MHGLRAAKMLRKVARVSRMFAWHAKYHPDNNPDWHFDPHLLPPGYWVRKLVTGNDDQQTLEYAYVVDCYM